MPSTHLSRICTSLDSVLVLSGSAAATGSSSITRVAAIGCTELPPAPTPLSQEASLRGAAVHSPLAGACCCGCAASVGTAAVLPAAVAAAVAAAEAAVSLERCSGAVLPAAHVASSAGCAASFPSSARTRVTGCASAADAATALL